MQGTVYTYLLNSPPSIANQAFSVAEDDDGSGSFATVVASDAESTVTFAIIGGTGGGLFLIDANTGALTVDTTLDYESTTSYTLDGGSDRRRKSNRHCDDDGERFAGERQQPDLHGRRYARR